MSTPLVRAARRPEEARGLDRVDDALRPAAQALVRRPRVRSLLHGHWLGHAVHPLMTDFPLGMWASGTLLDLVGGEESRPAARRLVGWGVLAALPTALTGAAEWGAIDERRDRRTGIVHAAVNSVALVLYTKSWLARRRGEDARGRRLAIAGGIAATVGGFYGGHLTEVRNVSSRHPSFERED
jgi:uncharacterized membrane protein